MKRTRAIPLLVITAGATGVSVYNHTGGLTVLLTLVTIGALAHVSTSSCNSFHWSVYVCQHGTLPITQNPV